MGEKYITDYYNSYQPFNQSILIDVESKERLELNERYKYHIKMDRLSYDKKGVYEGNERVAVFG